jgi:hypothetical protein
VTEHPILFKGEMVRAILEGRKTQTRRVVKNLDLMQGLGSNDQPGFEDESGDWHKTAERCPYGSPGDRLWVRETFSIDSRSQAVFYRASHEGEPYDSLHGKWRPSIFMPRSESRLDLEVLEVQVQRVQDISEADAQAEGASLAHLDDLGQTWQSYKRGFEALWDSINEPRGLGWQVNPWVWVVKFRRIKT